MNMETATLDRPKCELAELHATGDIKTIWDPENEQEVEIARKQFDRLTKDGFSIFRVNAIGKAGEKMREFDPRAEKLIAVPRIVGG
jgi:hypothetical protein